MKVIIKKNYEEVSQTAADIVANLVKDKPNLVFCLPAGSSPIGMYEKLVSMATNKEVDFSQMITLNMDEYLGLDSDDQQSFAYFTNQHFLKHININPSNIHQPRAKASDINSECVRYALLIEELGGLDLAISGLGDNGHLAFNEPGESLSLKTHQVNLDEATIRANSRFFDNDLARVPKGAISIGMEEIMKCRNFLVIASGKHKAPILEKLFSQRTVTTYYPASFLYLHNNATLILDEEAASLIPRDIDIGNSG